MKSTSFTAGASLLTLSLLLAACGGDGVNSTPTPTPGGTPTPTPGTPTPTTPTPTTPTPTTPTPTTPTPSTPTPTPGGTPTPTPGGTPTPTPTPPPAPVAAVFQGLPSNTAINSASLDGSVALNGTKNITQGDLGSRIQVRYVVSGNKIELLRNNSVIASFAPNELSAESTDTFALYTRGKVIGTELPQHVFQVSVPSINGVNLSYTRFGTYAKINANILNVNASNIDPLVAFVFGQPTANNAMPTTGTATYNSDVMGAVVIPNGLDTQFYTLGGGHGSATFSANFGSGSITTAINLDADGRAFGTINGSGSILSGGPAFNGTISGAGDGRFTGAFFGPNAAEMGYVFEAQGSGFVTYGNVFGAKAPTPPPP